MPSFFVLLSYIFSPWSEAFWIAVCLFLMNLPCMDELFRSSPFLVASKPFFSKLLIEWKFPSCTVQITISFDKILQSYSYLVCVFRYQAVSEQKDHSLVNISQTPGAGWQCSFIMAACHWKINPALWAEKPRVHPWLTFLLRHRASSVASLSVCPGCIYRSQINIQFWSKILILNTWTWLKWLWLEWATGIGTGEFWKGHAYLQSWWEDWVKRW